jgi:gluconate 5-dehydrogenase
MNLLDLSGHAAIVTGAGKGLGEGFAKVLAEAGAHVLLTGRHSENIARVSEELNKKYGECSSHIKADASNEGDAERTVNECIRCFGKVDILVNNAAAMRNNISPDETTPEQFEEVMRPNVTGVFMLSKAAARDMRKRRYGRIVNIASMSALVVNKGVHGGSYEVSKAAVLMLTRTLATEWAKDGICVNAICPGYYLTDPNKEFFAKDPAFYRNVIEMIPAGRLGELHELRGVLLLLCSAAASYIHGTAITVDGGYTLW